MEQKVASGLSGGEELSQAVKRVWSVAFWTYYMGNLQVAVGSGFPSSFGFKFERVGHSNFERVGHSNFVALHFY